MQQHETQETRFVENYRTISHGLSKVCALAKLVEHYKSPEFPDESALGFTGEIIRNLITEVHDLLEAVYHTEAKRSPPYMVILKKPDKPPAA